MRGGMTKNLKGSYRKANVVSGRVKGPHEGKRVKYQETVRTNYKGATETYRRNLQKNEETNRKVEKRKKNKRLTLFSRISGSPVLTTHSRLR